MIIELLNYQVFERVVQMEEAVGKIFGSFVLCVGEVVDLEISMKCGVM
jgi:hypothetical protein